MNQNHNFESSKLKKKKEFFFTTKISIVSLEGPFRKFRFEVKEEEMIFIKRNPKFLLH